MASQSTEPMTFDSKKVRDCPHREEGKGILGKAIFASRFLSFQQKSYSNLKKKKTVKNVSVNRGHKSRTINFPSRTIL